MPLARLLFHSHAAHLTALLAFLGATLWNGAAFYIEVFSHRYNLQIGEAARCGGRAGPAAALDEMQPPALPPREAPQRS